MPKERRYAHRASYALETVPFDSAEDAWFWFIRCQAVRAEGARFEAGFASVARPCDPDDIAACLISLVRQRVLARPHLRVLGTYGTAFRPPDSRDRHESNDSRLWESALDKMTTVLARKGIIACRDAHSFHEPPTPYEAAE